MKRALLEADEKPAKKSALSSKKSGNLRKAKPARLKSKRWR